MGYLITILHTFFIIFFVLMIFNVMIIVHELGHYWAALWRKLVVEKFQIWFGKPIWKKKINGVQWGLGTIPAGGFVALPQMAPMEMVEGEAEADKKKLKPAKPIDKIITAFAGPLFSFLLAIVFAFIVYWIGRSVGKSELTTVIGSVSKGMPAEKAGLRVGDKILSINEKMVNRWSGLGNSVQSSIVLSSGKSIIFEIDRGGEVIKIPVGFEIKKTKAYERPGPRQVGLESFYQPMVGSFTSKIFNGKTPAEKAGLRKSDIIVSVNGVKITAMSHIAKINEIIKESNGDEVVFEVRRPGESAVRSISVKPEYVSYDGEVEGEKVKIDRWQVGFAYDIKGEVVKVYPTPKEQVWGGVTFMYRTIKALTDKKTDVSVKHLSGPVGIINLYYMLLTSDDWLSKVLWFSVVLNINLAIMNMLPLPVLDGGHIVLGFLEMLRGRPIKTKILEYVQVACFMLLFGFMLYVTFYDAQDVGFMRGIIDYFKK